MGNRPSHELVRMALESLRRMSHRGGLNGDGGTGDGCGVLLQKPDAFLREVAREELGVTLGDSYAAGNVFLSRDAERADAAKRKVEAIVRAEGLRVLGWRPLPIDEEVCAPLAKRSCPSMTQLFVDGDCDENELGRRVFIVKRRAEIALADDQDFYICSLAPGVLCYKSMVMPERCAEFYADLRDARLGSAICVFHVRYATNTPPFWRLAQPFRVLAHNGEINTIKGNRHWASACNFSCERLPEADELEPLVGLCGSDSSSLDNMLELMLAAGIEPLRAMRVLVPPAWEQHPLMDDAVKDFYRYHAACMSPWDGPGGIVMTEGRYAVCIMDRNGLRPARYWRTDDGLLIAGSEVGIADVPEARIIAKGRLRPGGILAVDVVAGEFLDNADVETRLASSRDWQRWIDDQTPMFEAALSASVDATDPEERMSDLERAAADKYFQLSMEERDQVLMPLLRGEGEGTGSMGDDVPMAVLSRQQRPLYDLFRQLFAQVTNPPIDSLRETQVMSLSVELGRDLGILAVSERQSPEPRVSLPSPILLPEEMRALHNLDSSLAARRIDCSYEPGTKNLHKALLDIGDEAERLARDGAVTLILSDRVLKPDRLPVHSLLAIGAVQRHLTDRSLRARVNLIVESGSARDPHQIATLFGFGATAVYPWLGMAVARRLGAADAELPEATLAQRNYRDGLAKGLRKIMSKMGIATLHAYRGSALFEVVGLAQEVMDLCFPDASSRLGGMDFGDLEEDMKRLAERAWDSRSGLVAGGLLKYIHGGEAHAFNPDLVTTLHKMVRGGDESLYRSYNRQVVERDAMMLRDLLRLAPKREPLPLDKVESEEAILTRFDSAGMSLGALSPEAHESLAVAMNRLGGRSNSGEGGEDPARYDDERCSKIKQVASGRFGVTPHYLVNAEVLQIKIAQGAKPGEGGQLPGGKVNPMIAQLRFATPGVTLISPPPHHDIYSIEDLAQLIYDLKEVNDQALVSVKLVASVGVGTIATGVAKAGADMITISGYDGGTGASPLSSIRYAGSPWELGLSETHQALRANELRDKVRLQVDGGLKVGLDIVKGAILGAESFGFGTAPMMALGCKYLRICHLNNCATGIATQDSRLREHHYVGKVEELMHFFRFIAADVRAILASLGVADLPSIVGRTDLLEVAENEVARRNKLNLEPILSSGEADASQPHIFGGARSTARGRRELSDRLMKEVGPCVEDGGGGRYQFDITNVDRAIGANLSGLIARRHGAAGLVDNPIEIEFRGVTGQSFAAWNSPGLHLHVIGEANDYVGKGMAGGRIVMAPSAQSNLPSHQMEIGGNTCLYGATGGEFYAAGRFGERFAVRNSGACAVIEGAGDHCCEYMTGGIVVALGLVGMNFGAGMTNGLAVALDEGGDFQRRCNLELIEVSPLSKRPQVAALIAELLEVFVERTNSARGRAIVADMDRAPLQLIAPRGTAAQFDELVAREHQRWRKLRCGAIVLNSTSSAEYRAGGNI